MKKFLAIVMISVVGLIATLIVAQDAIIAPLIKNELEKRATAALGEPVAIERMHVQLFPPVSVSMEKVHVALKKPVDAVVTLPEVRARVALSELLSKKIMLQVSMQEPRVLLTAPEVAPAAPKAPETAPSISFDFKELDPWLEKVSLGFHLKVVKGVIDYAQGPKEYKLKDLSFDLHAENIKDPWVLSSSGEVDLSSVIAGVNISLPWSFAGDFTLKPETLTVQIQRGTVDLAGLAGILSGSSQLLSGVHSWDLNLSVAELSQLKVPPQFLPKGTWAGSIQAAVHATRAAGADWQASGALKLDRLNGQVQYEEVDKKISGQLLGNLDLVFKYGENLFIEKCLGSFSATGADINIVKKFIKPVGIALEASVDTQASLESAQVNNLAFRFATLRGAAKGNLGLKPGMQSQMEVFVERTTLVGFEKFFPMLAGTPVQGVVELKAKVSGDFSNSKSLAVNVNPLRLENFKGAVKWASKDNKNQISGPVALNALAVVVAQGQDFKNATVDSQVDLTGMAIGMEGVLDKRSGVPLKLELKAKKNGNAFEIISSRLSSSAGAMTLKGRVTSPNQPKLDLTLFVPSLDLNNLSLLMPVLAPYKVSGNVEGQVKVTGFYDFKKGIQESPLATNGTVSVRMPEFKIEKPKDQAVVAKPAALLPSWPVIKNSNLVTQVHIDNLKYQDLAVKGMDFRGTVKQGLLIGNLKLEDVFGGHVYFDSLNMSLLEVMPPVVFRAHTENIDIQKATEWMTPQWKELVQGRLSGTIYGTAAHPSQPKFLEETRITGKGNITDAYLKTLQFDEFINKKLSTIGKLVGVSKVKTEGTVKGKIDFALDLASGVLHFKPFDFLMNNKSEFNSQGWVRVQDKKFDLSGQAYLTDAPVQGVVLEANSDNQGRLVVPVRFSGNVMSPDLNMSEETVNKMISNTANYSARAVKKEVGKQVDKVKEDFQKAVERRLKGVIGN